MTQSLGEKERSGAVLIAAVAGLLLLVLPAFGLWESLNRRAEAAQSRLRGLETSVRDAATASQAASELQARATVYADPAGIHRQPALMLQQVQGLPGYSRLSVRRLEGLPLRDEKDFYRSGVSLQFVCELDELYRFLQDVETASPLLKIERLKLSADRSDSRRVEGQVVLSAYAVTVQRDRKG